MHIALVVPVTPLIQPMGKSYHDYLYPNHTVNGSNLCHLRKLNANSSGTYVVESAPPLILLELRKTKLKVPQTQLCG